MVEVMPPIIEKAHAKINLTLKIEGRRQDGYHELSSLVGFAQHAYDIVTLSHDTSLSLETCGPTARAIDRDNLVIQLLDALHQARLISHTGHVKLDKRLPVSAGIGGGSADAAAGARAVARLNGVDRPEIAFASLAAKLGADIPVCLGGGGRTGAHMSGIGENVWRPAEGTVLPPGGVPILLVNPGVGVPTGAVFNALGAPNLAHGTSTAPSNQCFANVEDCLDYLQANENDLQNAAVTYAPIIAEVITTLAALDGCALARMSGSGPTCYGLFRDPCDAVAAADTMKKFQPNWWICASHLQ